MSQNPSPCSSMRDQQWDTDVDVIVLGAGAGGMTAALVAATQGMKTLLIEKSGTVGGTTAYSSGTTWIPNNPHMHHMGMVDDARKAAQYLDALVGNRADPALRQAFITDGPKMVAYLERHTEVRFKAYPAMPDYRHDIPGAGTGGRPMEPLPFDGRLLGRNFNLLRPPIPELTILGGMMLTRGEAALLLRGFKSLDALRLGIRLLARHGMDRLRYRRGTRLVLGNALAARLYKSLLDSHVDIRLGARTLRLIMVSGSVAGIEVMLGDKLSRIRARRGVILAGGGFPASQAMREQYLPSPVAQYTPACPDSTGETIHLALDAGAAMGKGSAENALWFPSSIAQRNDQSTAVYPHIVLDRPKPGLIAVDSAGRRFVNEAVSYHEFTRAMYKAGTDGCAIPAILICDRRFLWKYGLGMIRPHALSIRRHIKNGYLLPAPTLEGLADKLGISSITLKETVERYNGFSRTGHDEDFNKGNTPYERANGDPQHKPNPCLGEISKAPFYAVKLYPTPLGTSLGLAINTQAQVLDHAGKPLPGLYACGNDADSIFGGEYPGAGAQIGPAMTYGYLSAMHIVNN
ncbi:FAD-dependent oxidoreductase [Pusillimonas sp. MFBS29]|uniref:FAD-binding protein n=1 Tax=Pusillimonas sp. MFBS29 TaxID=2886690 RepID=UPI001D121D3C|nr:FAD-binding protein [Pusillimonas sp. MFBS29]MCC2596842.1 FAD-dependent oxidoreductase [Pusillimonas sp. MFBS29]